ncbi:MAG: hypothetical protein ACRD2C_14440 [Acidimicrobiales bacterium]
MDLAGLAQVGAAAIIGAMATDTWAEVRSRLARFFAGDDADREGEEADRLEDASRALILAPDTERGEVIRNLRSELQGALHLRLRDAPDAAADLATLIDEIGARLPGTSSDYIVSQQATAGSRGIIYQAGRDIHRSGEHPDRR